MTKDSIQYFNELVKVEYNKAKKGETTIKERCEFIESIVELFSLVIGKNSKQLDQLADILMAEFKSSTKRNKMDTPNSWHTESKLRQIYSYEVAAFDENINQ